MKPLRDSDTADRMQKMRALGFSILGGVIFALAGAIKFGFPGFLLGWLGGAGIIYMVSMLIAGGAGNAASSIYFGSGSSTPHNREYSLAESYVVRGRLHDAADEYERCATMYPKDINPPLRLARLYRDQLNDATRAAEWFRRTLSIPGLQPHVEVAVMRELIELYEHRSREPARAMPLLAKLAEKHPDTPSGKWAREELGALKREVQS